MCCVRSNICSVVQWWHPPAPGRSRVRGRPALRLSAAQIMLQSFNKHRTSRYISLKIINYPHPNKKYFSAIERHYDGEQNCKG